MTLVLFIPAFVALAVFGLILAGKCANLQRDRLANLDRHSAEFAACAIRLADADTPSAILDSLAALNQSIGVKGSARVMAESLSRIEKEATYHTVKGRIQIELEECDHAVRTSIEPILQEAIRAGLLAMSYSDLFWGVISRAMMAEHRQQDMTPRLVKKVSEGMAQDRRRWRFPNYHSPQPA